MILAKSKILSEIQSGSIQIDPFSYSQLNPNSYNLRLNNKLLIYNEAILDCKKQNDYFEVELPEDGFIIYPGKLYLGSTVEKTYTNKYVPIIEGRSSLARLGLIVHITAGFGDVGFDGHWTLEITAIQPIRIYPDMEVCQVYYTALDGEPEPYIGKYNNNSGVQASRLFQDFKETTCSN